MTESRGPGLFSRLILAWVAFFAILGDRLFAGQVQKLRQGLPADAPPPALPAAPAPATPAAPAPATPAAPPAPRLHPGLHLLALLQREGRLLDFLQEDIASFSDEEVGAAARAVHLGCREALAPYVVLEPLRTEPEGTEVTLPAGFDAAQVRLIGNVVGDPPFRGILRHPGWRAARPSLPLPAADADLTILAPAEVELP